MRTAVIIMLLISLNSCFMPEKIIPPDGMRSLGRNKQGYYEFENVKDGSVLIFIPRGEFVMGIKDNPPTPVHRVNLSNCMIGKYEVTNKQYKQFCDETGRPYPDDPEFIKMKNYFIDHPDYPVVNISWYDASAYCNWAGLKLPTEAQWEKGARGTDSRRYPWGNEDIDGSRCNIADKNLASYEPYWDWINTDIDDGYINTAPVNSYEKGVSPYGLYNMFGNVSEWCFDYYDIEYYFKSPYYNPVCLSNSRKYYSVTGRVKRGESWESRSFESCVGRTNRKESTKSNSLGFRVGYY